MGWLPGIDAAGEDASAYNPGFAGLVTSIRIMTNNFPARDSRVCPQYRRLHALVKLTDVAVGAHIKRRPLADPHGLACARRADPLAALGLSSLYILLSQTVQW